MIDRDRRPANNSDPKWFNSPVQFYEGTLSDIGHYIPDFERRSFGLTQPDDNLSRINERLDLIVRKPVEIDHNYVPVGVVSKAYTLVPHKEVLNMAIQAIEANSQIDVSQVKAELTITEYGERMALSLYLPERFSFCPSDGHPLSLRLECFNSVDGSTRFRALMGWFRFVCSNGLIIGVTQSDIRRRHVGDLKLSDIGSVLTSGIEESEWEKGNFEKWRKKEIEPGQVVKWVEEDLRNKWGFKAAARAYHISTTGFDVQITGPFKENTPTSIPVEKIKRVQGAPLVSRNLYDLSQALAWLAKERRDLQEQLEWREDISVLLKPFLN
jgi:hypothetical protein